MAKKNGIRVISPKFGVSRAGYFFNPEDNTIAKGIASVKYLSEQIADELYELSQKTKYETFSDLLYDICRFTTIDTRQLEILIKIDFFSDFGNQKELITIADIFSMFSKKGKRDEFRKQIQREHIEGTIFEEIVREYATDKTKAGKDAKSFTLLDPLAIVRGCEQKIMSLNMKDLPVNVKCQNFKEYMGYSGYCTGREEDRSTLFIKSVFPLKRKLDGKLFGYNILTQSIGGEGKESSFTVMKRRFDEDPIKEGDIIKCMSWKRDGMYFRMEEYNHIFA